MEEYLGRANKTVAELREETRPLATKKVIRALTLAKIVEEEKIEVSDAEIDDEIENVTKGATENKEGLEKVLNTPQARESIGQTLITRKAVQRLTEMAKETKKAKTTKTPKTKQKEEAK